MAEEKAKFWASFMKEVNEILKQFPIISALFGVSLILAFVMGLWSNQSAIELQNKICKDRIGDYEARIEKLESRRVLLLEDPK